MSRLHELLEHVVEVDASDLHLKVNNPPIIRLNGDLVRMDQPAFGDDELQNILLSLLTEERKERLQNFKELDMSYAVEGLALVDVEVA